MRKVLALAFIGSLFVVNCSKKPENNLQDSNTMLEEPEATTVVDSTAKKVTPDASTTPAPATPEAAKTDSAAAKK